MLAIHLQTPSHALDITPHLNEKGVLDITNGCCFENFKNPNTTFPQLAALNRYRVAQAYQGAFAPCSGVFYPCGGTDGLYPTAIANAPWTLLTGTESYNAISGQHIAQHCQDFLEHAKNDFSHLLGTAAVPEVRLLPDDYEAKHSPIFQKLSEGRHTIVFKSVSGSTHHFDVHQMDSSTGETRPFIDGNNEQAVFDCSSSTDILAKIVHERSRIDRDKPIENAVDPENPSFATSLTRALVAKRLNGEIVTKVEISPFTLDDHGGIQFHDNQDAPLESAYHNAFWLTSRAPNGVESKKSLYLHYNFYVPLVSTHEEAVHKPYFDRAEKETHKIHAFVSKNSNGEDIVKLIKGFPLCNSEKSPQGTKALRHLQDLPKEALEAVVSDDTLQQPAEETFQKRREKLGSYKTGFSAKNYMDVYVPKHCELPTFAFRPLTPPLPIDHNQKR